MSNESDGQSPSGNIDAIKELLRKLEEVAVRDPSPAQASFDSVAEPAAAAAEPSVAEPRDALLALNRGSSLRALGDMSPARPIIIDTVPAAATAASTATSASVAGKSSGRGIAIAAGSFVLGVAAAGALLLAFQPLSTLFRSPAAPGPATVAQQLPPAAPAGAQSEAPRPADAPRASSGSPSTSAAVPSPVSEPLRTAETTPAAAPATAPASSEPARTAPASHPPPISPPTPVQVRSAPLQANSPASEKVADVDWRIQLPDRIELRAGERRTVDVRLSPPVSETSRLLVVLRNVPAWLSLSKGGAVGKEIWLLPAHQASDVALEVAEGANGNTDLVVQLASIDGRILAERTIAVRATGLPASNAPMVASAPAGSDQMLLRLQARGELLLDTGEIEAARTLFRTAAEAGSVSAALRLAETYDPGEIQRFGMMETAADPVLAVRWYEHAQALGSPVATARLATLGRR